VALEGALKLKEIAYMHAEGFAAGELKHGPIALVEQDVPVFVVVPSPRGRSVLHDKIVSNIQEVRARGARTIVIAEEGDEAVVPYADHIVRIPPRVSPRVPRGSGRGPEVPRRVRRRTDPAAFWRVTRHA
jgi:glucosamine--fructose-6-phosphate aminotransferase (isomerizing)